MSRCWRTCLLVLVCCAGFACALRKGPETYGVPSVREIKGNITLPSGEKVGFTNMEGALLAVKRPSDRSVYMAFGVTDHKEGFVEYFALRVKVGSRRKEKAQQVRPDGSDASEAPASSPVGEEVSFETPLGKIILQTTGVKKSHLALPPPCKLYGKWEVCENIWAKR